MTAYFIFCLIVILIGALLIRNIFYRLGRELPKHDGPHNAVEIRPSYGDLLKRQRGGSL
jgi:hypothetical protein